MLYYYDKEKLEYRFAKKLIALTILSIFLFFIVLFFLFKKEFNKKNHKKLIDISSVESEEIIVIINNADDFSEIKLKNYLLELNIKFPDIAFAQARYESGNWGQNPKANLFERNNNLFGMKVATSRTTTNHGEQFGHANYNHWRMSVIDYAMWQDAYTRNLKTREDYISYLKRVYAEGTYISIINITNEVRKKYPELCVKNYPKLSKKNP